MALSTALKPGLLTTVRDTNHRDGAVSRFTESEWYAFRERRTHRGIRIRRQSLRDRRDCHYGGTQEFLWARQTHCGGSALGLGVARWSPADQHDEVDDDRRRHDNSGCHPAREADAQRRQQEPTGGA